MKYEKHLSKLRHLVFHMQGQSLKQVLLRAAAQVAEGIANNVYHSEEIFSVLKEKIYEHTNEMTSDACYNIVSDAECLAEIKDELVNTPAEPFEWEETLFVLLEGLSKKDRAILEPLLKNQHSHNLQCISMGSDTPDMSTFRDLMIVMVRRIYMDMPVRTLVGMQPMQGPVGLSYLLKYRAKDKETNEYIDVPADTDRGLAAEAKEIRLEVTSQAVEAYSRKLKAGWTLEAMQDLNCMNGLDIEAELVAALSSEIRDEISNEILHDLTAMAGEPERVKLEGSTEKQITHLGIHINRLANEIARKTRRGAGNWIVVPHLVGAILSDAKTFESVEFAATQMPHELREIGILNGTIKVFSKHSQPDDEILVGYKGHSDTDTGYVHCPYVPVMSTGVVVDPETFQPLIKLMTRYGKTLNGGEWEKDRTEPHIAANYYKLLKIESDFFAPKKEDE